MTNRRLVVTGGPLVVMGGAVSLTTAPSRASRRAFDRPPRRREERAILSSRRLRLPVLTKRVREVFDGPSCEAAAPVGRVTASFGSTGTLPEEPNAPVGLTKASSMAVPAPVTSTRNRPRRATVPIMTTNAPPGTIAAPPGTIGARPGVTTGAVVIMAVHRGAIEDASASTACFTAASNHPAQAP
jgi:hypothetical protein